MLGKKRVGPGFASPTLVSNMYKLALTLLLTFTAISHANEQRLEIISLQHRLATDLIPTLQPFVDKQGVISTQNNQLIIRTSDNNLEEIKSLINQLDQPLKRLLIEVKQPLSNSRESTQDSISGRIAFPDGKAQISLNKRSTSSRDSNATHQQIQVLDGHTAVIKTGRQVPMATKQIRDGRHVETVIEHKDVSSGFQITPHLNGETVLLKITPFSTSLASTGGGIINQQHAATTVSSTLGEWIEIAGVASQDQQSGHTKTYSTKQRDEIQRQILIRVTELQ